MANTITDNRTVLFNGDSVTGDNGGRWDTLGSTSEALNTDVKIEGTASLGEQFSDGVRTLIWDSSTTVDLTNAHVYIWVNCGIVGLLATKAAGGFAIRFTGASSADFFEYYVGGSDSWPTAVEGGWVQFVVDLAAATSNTGGTPPAVSAVVGIGISGVTATVMTKVSDNTWIDAGWYLPAATPGLIIQGRNGGTTDWNSADIFTQLGTSPGIFLPAAGGTWKVNVPVQFGINDTSTHGFTDTNAIWLWDNQEFVAADHYGLSALGNVGGTTNVTMGIKTGTGDAATGAQGLTIVADAAGTRWFMDFSDPNLDLIGLYGCSFIHGAALLLDDPAVSVISSLYIDCTAASVTGSEQLRVSTVNPDTATSTAFMTLADLDTVVLSTFGSLSGHALELTTAADATWDSGLSGYDVGSLGSPVTPTATGDEAIYVNVASGTINISVAAGSPVPSIRRAGGSTAVINVTGVVTKVYFNVAPTPSPNYEWRLYTVTGENSLAGAVEIAGSETETLSSGEHTHVYTNQWVALQVISNDYEESTQWSLITGDHTFTVNLETEANA
jgi:hypothetical protein